MTIEEAKAAKDALRQRLRQELQQFTDDTGLIVERLDLTAHRIVDGGCSHWVELEGAQ